MKCAVTSRLNERGRRPAFSSWGLAFNQEATFPTNGPVCSISDTVLPKPLLMRYLGVEPSGSLILPCLHVFNVHSDLVLHMTVLVLMLSFESNAYFV